MPEPTSVLSSQKLSPLIMVSLGTFTAFEETSQCLTATSTPFDSTVAPSDCQVTSESADVPLGLHSPKRPKNGLPVEDTLTCGSCLRDFSLSDITKFIDHKAINGCEFGHKKCKLDLVMAVDSLDDSDCCSCLDFDLSSSGNSGDKAHSPEASRTDESNNDRSETSSAVVAADSTAPEISATMETDQADQSATMSIKKEPSDCEYKEVHDEGVHESVEIDSTKSDDKENQPSGNQSEECSSSSTVPCNNADSKKESSVLSESGTNNQEVSGADEKQLDSNDTQQEQHPATEEKTPEGPDGNSNKKNALGRSVLHNHFCRHYRRLCKHYQNTLLNRASLSDAHTNTGETFIDHSN